MLFTSYSFILLCVLVICLYYVLPGKYQWKFLLAVSLLFYCHSSPAGLAWMLLTAFIVWFCALRIGRLSCEKNSCPAEQKENPNRELQDASENRIKRKQKSWFLAAVMISLGSLLGLKYGNFFLSNILPAANQASPAEKWLVPMGISFYTLQALGYLIDIYWEKYEPEKSPGRFLLFVSFFPQLIQGPISRFDHLRRSLFQEHRFERKTVAFGLQRILWGYFKKLVIADRILKAMNVLLQNADFFDGIFVVVGMAFYAVEIYADFTGGIDITLGIAEAMGIRVRENFCRPYFAKSLKEYWNRWHISLGDWMEEYVFYPVCVSRPMRVLSGNARKYLGEAAGKRIPVYISVLTVWFLTGLWHGASWNFILWGLGNGVVLLVSRECVPLYRAFHKRIPVENCTWFKGLQCMRTLLIVSILRLLDCYRDVPLTFHMLKSVFCVNKWEAVKTGWLLWIGLSAVDYAVVGLGVLLMFGVSLMQRKGAVREKIAKKAWPVRFCIWYGLFLAVLMTGAYGPGYEASQFIYYQF